MARRGERAARSGDTHDQSGGGLHPPGRADQRRSPTTPEHWTKPANAPSEVRMYGERYVFDCVAGNGDCVYQKQGKNDEVNHVLLLKV